MKHISTKVIDIGSAAFRQWRAKSHCRFVHGYNLHCKLWFTSASLDENNWVYDFGACKDIKKILEDQFDHTMVVAADDPELETFKDLDSRGIVQLRVMEDGVGIERSAEWIFKRVNQFLEETTDDRVAVSRVEVWEHERNSACVEGLPRASEYGIDYNKFMETIDNMDPEQIMTGMPPLAEVEIPQVETPEPPPVVEPIDLSALQPPVLEPETVINNPPAPDRAAPIGNKPTEGKGNWFKGTTWG